MHGTGKMVVLIKSKCRFSFTVELATLNCFGGLWQEVGWNPYDLTETKINFNQELPVFVIKRHCF